MAITVSVSHRPWLQLMLLIFLTMAYLIYILQAKSILFEDENRNRLEVTAEALNLMAIVLLM